MTERTSTEPLPVRLSLGREVSIELLRQGEHFLGLGAISHGGVALRSRRRPMFVEIRNTSALELLNYRVTQCDVSSGRVLLLRWMRWRPDERWHEVRLAALRIDRRAETCRAMLSSNSGR
jgi:hypothetical protein